MSTLPLPLPSPLTYLHNLSQRSSVMTNRIIPGTYVIRNKQTSTALHAQTDNSLTWTSLKPNENDYRDEQIWWIEPILGCENNEEGELYSITHISSGKSLTVGRRGELQPIERKLGLYPPSDFHGQKWTIKKVEDLRNRNFYNIINYDYGDVIDVLAGVGDGLWGSLWSPFCSARKYVAGRERQCWEFARPVVAFNAGWFQIRNVSTDCLLSHTYLECPPVLIQPPDPARPSKYRETWGTQWCLVSPNTLCRGAIVEKNVWIIKNRLTEGLLNNRHDKFPGCDNGISVGCTKSAEFRDKIDPGYLWKLELDQDDHWKIIQNSTFCFLEQSDLPLFDGREVVCTSEQVPERYRRKSWDFLSPNLEAASERVGEANVNVVVPKRVDVLRI